MSLDESVFSVGSSSASAVSRQPHATDNVFTTPQASIRDGWVVMRDPPDYPDKIIGRLVTDRPTPC